MKDKAQTALQARLKELGGPYAAQLWRHWKGGIYVVCGTSVQEDTGEALVHYRSQRRGANWTRTLTSWCEQVKVGSVVMECDGKPVMRFARIPDVENEDRYLIERMSPVYEFVQEHLEVEKQDFMKQLHEELRYNCNNYTESMVIGLLLGMKMAGRLTQVEIEGWLTILRKCPGHDGMSFCAYCGDVAREEEDEHSADASGET